MSMLTIAGGIVLGYIGIVALGAFFQEMHIRSILRASKDEQRREEAKARAERAQAFGRRLYRRLNAQ